MHQKDVKTFSSRDSTKLFLITLRLAGSAELHNANKSKLAFGRTTEVKDSL